MSAGADVLWHVVVVDLADSRGEVSLVAKHLRHRLHVGQVLADVNGVAMDQRLVGIEARHEAASARSADRTLAIGMGKSRASLHE